MAVRAALVPSHDARGALLKAVTDLQYGSLACICEMGVRSTAVQNSEHTKVV